MRACIITFQSANNYGAVLQAYALQKYLNETYADTRIVDYHNSSIDKSYMQPRLVDFFHSPKNAIFRTMQAVLFKGKNAKIDMFRKKYLPLTKRYEANTISSALEEGDVFITGSDQVWNYLIVEQDKTYYLDFAKEKRTCSYAASFGVDMIPTEYQQFYRQQLCNIEYLSVREEKGAELVRELSNQNVAVMPDPTLLIKREIWEDICITPDIKMPYILVYKITKADHLLQFAKNLSKKTGLPIIYIPNDLKSGTIGSLKLDIGPQEFLGYIRNAEYIVTNSFHGTVFSIIFGRKFFSEMSKRVNPSTSRLHSLLTMFGLEDRTFEKYSESMLDKELPMDDISRKLDFQRREANLFFDKVFNGVKS